MIPFRQISIASHLSLYLLLSPFTISDSAQDVSDPSDNGRKTPPNPPNYL